MLSANAYKVAMAKLADLAFRLEKKFGVNLKYIDIGGGFASKNTLKGSYLPGKDTVPSFDEYAEAITSALLNSEINPKKLPVLILETGRALIDDAGYLLGTVIANKRLADGRRATIVDIGVNLIFTSFWYEHEIHPAKPSSEHLEESTIYGPLCMNIDVLRETIAFPILKKGDHFVIIRIGAYNMTQWMQFITLRPNVVLIDANGKDHIIRKAEKLEDVMASEYIPEHLV
jgi:diaminopimelate decarboxylase